VEIGGHTDNVGREDYNQKLSERRANEVKNQLMALGVKSIQLTAVGYGSRKPLVTNSTDANRAVNRRILFKIL
jgi:OOP family OmpA-OmpF porin